MTIGRILGWVVGIALVAILVIGSWRFLSGTFRTMNVQVPTAAEVGNSIEAAGERLGQLVAVETAVPTTDTVALTQDLNVAPQTLADAAAMLGVDVSYLTPLNYQAGNSTVIGWVVGKSPYSNRFTVKVPNGTCVDYIRSSGTLSGTTAWHIQYSTADWNRALMSEDGQTTGVKVTIYWSLCRQSDGGIYEIVPSGTTANDVSVRVTPTVAPTQVSQIAVTTVATTAAPAQCAKPTTVEGDWKELGSNGWVATSASFSNFTVPNGVEKIDYDGGSATTGQVLNYNGPATWWCAQQ